MTAVETNITPEQAAELLAEVQRLKAMVEQTQGPGMDPALLAQQRNGVAAALDAPPKSFPEGYVHGDARSRLVQRREMALAHVRSRAERSGGRFDPRFGSAYGHRDDREYRCAQIDATPEVFGETCQRKCWTPEREQRELQAAGLRDLVSGPVVPLSRPEKDAITRAEMKGSTIPAEGVAVLAALTQALGIRPQAEEPTVADVKGHYLAQGESATAETDGLTRSGRRRTM